MEHTTLTLLCGCNLEPDREGPGYLIHHCPMHKAAPDLLEACKGLLKHYLGGPGVEEAKKAVAKAEGA